MRGTSSAPGTLNFEEPDTDRFPALALAYRALEQGGTAGAVMNAAGEAAVAAFLNGQIRFTQIAELARRAMDELPAGDASTLGRVLEAAGAGFEHVVETTEYITTTEGYAGTAAVRREVFRPPYPAATGVIVAGLLRPGALIEISAVAVPLPPPEAPAP